jgi:sterol desaturase/sphingolipid hydroxylase (fatty acid hydroxylase superfamily)
MLIIMQTQQTNASNALPFPRILIAYLLWPGLLTGCILIYWIGLQMDYSVLGFNAAYFGLATALYFLEKKYPYEATWIASDGQVFNDLGHTALTKGFGQLLATSVSLVGLSEFGSATATGIWPSEWHPFFQVCLALLVADFGLYWAHRLAHEWWPAWCWHAVHHSVTKLWFVNTGRFHLFDSLWKVMFSLSIGLIIGAPKQIIAWVLVITPFIGFLTHCNVNMKCGWLSWIFNTPELHRWHHSRDAIEGNKNYGENIVFWDILFNTRFLPKDRRPPANIGCSDPVPTVFLGQIAYPLTAWLNAKK